MRVLHITEFLQNNLPKLKMIHLLAFSLGSFFYGKYHTITSAFMDVSCRFKAVIKERVKSKSNVLYILDCIGQYSVAGLPSYIQDKKASGEEASVKHCQLPCKAITIGHTFTVSEMINLDNCSLVEDPCAWCGKWWPCPDQPKADEMLCCQCSDELEESRLGAKVPGQIIVGAEGIVIGKFQDAVLVCFAEDYNDGEPLIRATGADCISTCGPLPSKVQEIAKAEVHKLCVNAIFRVGA